jgi:CheY-like chemotaxis protein
VGSNEMVLVVEDDSLILQALKLALEYRGYRVAIASDGREALELLDRTLPALIVLDLAMPRMDGAAFSEELRRRDLSAIPLLVVSADAHGPEKAAQIGAQGFLLKPFELPALLEEVARLTRG